MCSAVSKVCAPVSPVTKQRSGKSWMSLTDLVYYLFCAVQDNGGAICCFVSQRQANLASKKVSWLVRYFLKCVRIVTPQTRGVLCVTAAQKQTKNVSRQVMSSVSHKEGVLILCFVCGSVVLCRKRKQISHILSEWWVNENFKHSSAFWNYFSASIVTWSWTYRDYLWSLLWSIW